MTKLFLTCGLLAVLTACATSQPSPAAASMSATPAAAATTAPQTATATTKPKLICEDDARIDSHFHQRQCYTPEEMEARRKQAQADMQNYQSSGVCAQGGGGGACGGGGGGPPR